MKSCVKCRFIKVSADPDPHDWFCDDDVKAACTGIIDAVTGMHKLITVACRPHHLEKECETPEWCPLLR